MAGLSCNGLSVVFTTPAGREIRVLQDLSLSVAEGEFVTIFGPNGCGKSTLLNVLLGHTKATSGTITFTTQDPRLGYIFQDYRSALMPWLTARDNVCFPLSVAGISEVDIQERFGAIITGLPIHINWLAYPYHLSGGQAQLVSILRSLIIEPEVLLLDEPFSALDYQTNLYMLRWLQQISMERRVTMVFVSHQIDEAIFLGDKVVLLTPGPATVSEEIRIDLQRPRGLSIMGSESFRERKEYILARFLKMVHESDSV